MLSNIYVKVVRKESSWISWKLKFKKKKEFHQTNHHTCLDEEIKRVYINSMYSAT